MTPSACFDSVSSGSRTAKASNVRNVSLSSRRAPTTSVTVCCIRVDLVMDVRKMDAFQNSSFDIVIDKGAWSYCAGGCQIHFPDARHEQLLTAWVIVGVVITGCLDSIFASYNFISDIPQALLVRP